MIIDTSTLITVGGIILSAATFFIGRVSAGRATGKQDGMIQTDIGYIKAGIDDVKRRLERNDTEFKAIGERLAKVESSAASAHKRLDDHGVGRA